MKELKRSVALLLAALMLFACLSGVGMATDEISEDATQAETAEPVLDLGTTVDPETGEEYPILSSVEDILPEEDADPISVGAEEAEESESGEACLEDFAGAYDTTEIGSVDLSSCRILVAAENAETIITEDAVIAELDGLYLMQFEDEDTAKLAYMYYNDNADYADADIPVMIADDEAVAIEDADVTPIEMDETSNPFTELESAIADMSGDAEITAGSGKIIAVIDTGLPAGDEHVIGYYDVLGDTLYDDNGHGARVASAIYDMNAGARIISIKALDANGVGSASSIYAAVKLAMELNANIINLSLYAVKTTDNSIVEQIIREAISSGITVVGAAGNSSTDAAGYIPGCLEDAVIVGSVDENGRLQSFSNSGSTVDFYVCSGATSEAAAKVSGMISTGKALEEYTDAGELLTAPVERSDVDIDTGGYVFPEEVDNKSDTSALQFLYTFLCPYIMEYEHITDILPYVYSSVSVASYNDILRAAQYWDYMDEANKEAVDKALQLASNGAASGFADLANDAYIWLLIADDGKLPKVNRVFDIDLSASEQPYTDYLVGYMDYDPPAVIDAAYCEQKRDEALEQGNPSDAFVPASYSSTVSFASNAITASWNGTSYPSGTLDKITDFSYIKQNNGYVWYPYWVNTDSSGNGFSAYCLDYNKYFAGTGASVSVSSTYWNNLGSTTQGLVARAVFFGDAYRVNNNIFSNYTKWSSSMLATQSAIWSYTGYGYTAPRDVMAYYLKNVNSSGSSIDYESFYRTMYYMEDMLYLYGKKPSYAYAPVFEEVDTELPEGLWQDEEPVSTPAPETTPYQVGDIVYIDNIEFDITSIGDFDIQLLDPTQRYPIFRSESRENFERLLRLDERNRRITGQFPVIEAPVSYHSEVVEELPAEETGLA